MIPQFRITTNYLLQNSLLLTTYYKNYLLLTTHYKITYYLLFQLLFYSYCFYTSYFPCLLFSYLENFTVFFPIVNVEIRFNWKVGRKEVRKFENDKQTVFFLLYFSYWGKDPIRFDSIGFDSIRSDQIRSISFLFLFSMSSI